MGFCWEDGDFALGRMGLWNYLLFCCFCLDTFLIYFAQTFILLFCLDTVEFLCLAKRRDYLFFLFCFRHCRVFMFLTTPMEKQRGEAKGLQRGVQQGEAKGLLTVELRHCRGGIILLMETFLLYLLLHLFDRLRPFMETFLLYYLYGDLQRSLRPFIIYFAQTVYTSLF